MMMARGGVLLAAFVTLAAVMAGCTSGGTEVNPNLLAPKLIVDLGANGTPLVYVHSAFGERTYDLIEVRVDNETLASRSHAYSVETLLENRSFFLEVEAGASESHFEFRGFLVVDEDEERVRVTQQEPDGEWSEVRSHALPYERILERAAFEEDAS